MIVEELLSLDPGYQHAATCSVTLKYTASSMRFTLPTDVDKLYYVLFVHVFIQ